MEKRRRTKFGLLVLLLAVCGTGSIVGMVVRNISHPVYRSVSSNLQGGCHWEAKWRVVRGREELLYIFFIPQKATFGTFTSNVPGEGPDRTDISCLPEGLFVDGERVETTATRKVFVYTKQRKMRPVELSPDDLAKLTVAGVAEIENSSLWNDTIGPIVREEERRFE